MNIEELKLILGVLKDVSGDASSAATVWIALHYGTQIMNAILFAGTFIGAIWIITSAIVANIKSATQENEWAAQGRKVSKAWGGDGDHFGIYRNDIAALARAIDAAPAERTD